LIPPDQIQGKAEMLIEYEDRLNIFDSLILCRFYRDLYTWEELEKLVHMVTGLPSAKADLRRLAGSICTMTRCFNIREGLTPADDHLPHRFHSEKLPSGHCLTADEMGTMLKDYYTLREWNEQGVPLAMT
jgi:aldehyde:ferredoxin oxidoreductase